MDFKIQFLVPRARYVAKSSEPDGERAEGKLTRTAGSGHRGSMLGGLYFVMVIFREYYGAAPLLISLSFIHSSLRRTTMRKISAAFMLSVLALGSSTVHAATSITTEGFGITIASIGLAGDMELLSDAGGAARFNLDIHNYELGVPITLSSIPGSDFNLGYDRHWLPLGSEFKIDLHKGYRIDSIAVSGTLYGSLNPGIPPAAEYPSFSVIGEVTNSFDVELRLRESPYSTLAAQSYGAIQGDRSVLVASNQVFYDDLVLRLDTEFEVTARAGAYYGYAGPHHEHFVSTYDSSVTFGVRDLVLTVQVSPVPEPSTWSMLAAGFGLLAMAARSRRKA